MVEERITVNDEQGSDECISTSENQEDKPLKVFLSHDGYFRISFDDKKVAESFTKENLPAEITQYLDFSTMQIEKDTFVDQRLSRCFADVLYHIRFKDNPAYLYFLYEHKSWEPNFAGIQLLKNMISIWETYASKHKKVKTLPPIIPMLIYHGARPWKSDTNFISMFDIPEVIKKYIPTFQYELYDISHMPEEQIKGTAEVRIVMLALRYIYDPELFSHFKKIFDLFHELPDIEEMNKYLEPLLKYLGSNIKNISPEQLKNKIEEIFEEGGTIMPTVFQQLIQQGKDIGIKEGRDIGIEEGKNIGIKEGEEKSQLKIAVNCLLKGMDVLTISEITNLPIEQIETMHRLFSKGNTTNQ